MTDSGGSGSANIGAIEVSVTANTEKAIAELTRLEELIERISTPVEIGVKAGLGGASASPAQTKARRDENPPAASQQSSAPASSAVSVTARIEENLASQIRSAVQKAFEQPFDITLHITNLTEIQKQIGSIEVSSAQAQPGHAQSTVHGAATDLTLQQKRQVMQSQLAQAKATDAMLSVWRNGSNEMHRTSINNLVDEIGLRPAAYGGIDIGGGQDADKALRVMQGLLSGLQDPELIKKFTPYVKYVGHGEGRMRTLQGVPDELIQQAAPHADLTQEGVRQNIVGAIQNLPVFRNDRNTGYRAYYEGPQPEAHAPAPQPVAAPPAARVPAEAPVSEAQRSAVEAAKAAKKEIDQKITEAYQRAIDVEPINLGAIRGLAAPSPSTEPRGEFYRGKRVTRVAGLERGGRSMLGHYSSRDDAIEIDPEKIHASYERKGWTQDVAQEDGSIRHGLPENAFPGGEDDYTRFLLEHEYQHSRSRRRGPRKNSKGEMIARAETQGEYEDRISQAALMSPERTRSTSWSNGGVGWVPIGPQSAAARAAAQRDTPGRGGRVRSGEPNRRPTDVMIGHAPREVDGVHAAGIGFQAASLPPEVRPASDVAADLERFARLGVSRHSGGSQRRGSTSRTDNLSSMYSVGAVELPGLGAVDVGGILRAISSGMGNSTLHFGEVVQGRNKGEIRRLRPTEGSSQEDFDALLASVGHRAPITTASGERVRRIDAKELFRRILIEQYGQDDKAGVHVDEALASNQALAVALKLVAARGSAPLNEARGVSQMASNPVHDARLAVEFQSVSRQIEPLERELNTIERARLVGPRRRQRQQELKKQIEPLIARRNELIDAGADTSYYMTPDARQLAAMRLHDQERGAESRAGIEAGRGLSERELLERERPHVQNAATVERIKSGELPDIWGAVESASRRFHAPDFQYQPGPNGPESNAGAMRRLVEDELGGLGLKLSTRNKRSVATPMSGISLGREDQRTVNDMLSSALSAEFGHEATMNMYAEQSLNARASRQGGGRRRKRADEPMRPGDHTEPYSGVVYNTVDGNITQAMMATKGTRVTSASEDQAFFRGKGGVGAGDGLPPGDLTAYPREEKPTAQFAAGNAAIAARNGSLPPAPPTGTPGSPMGSGGSIHVWIDGPFPLKTEGGGGGGSGSPDESVPFSGSVGVPYPMRRRYYRRGPSRKKDEEDPGVGFLLAREEPAVRGDMAARHREAEAVRKRYRIKQKPVDDAVKRATGPTLEGPRDDEGVSAFTMYGSASRGGGDVTARHREAQAVRRRRREARSDEQAELRRTGDDIVRYNLPDGGFYEGKRKDGPRAVSARERAARVRQNEIMAEIPGAGILTTGGKLKTFERPLNDRALSIQSSIAQQQGQMQSRSMGTTFVSLAENLFGGREAFYKRAKTANQLSSRFTSIDNYRQNLMDDNFRLEQGVKFGRAQHSAAVVSGDSERAAAFKQQVMASTDALRNNRKVLAQVNPLWEKAGEEAEAAAAGVTTAGAVAQNLMAGAAGGVVGMMATQGISTVAQTVIQGLSAALGPSIENALGNPNVAAAANRANAQVLSQAGGNVGALAASYGSQGMSAGAYSTVSAQLEAKAQAELGNQNLAALGGAQRVAANQQGNPLWQTTNGWFGTPIGGTPSTAQIVNDQLGNLGQITTQGHMVKGTDPLSQLLGLQTWQQDSGPALSPKSMEAQKNLDMFNAQADKARSSLQLLAASTDDQRKASDKAAADAEKNGNQPLADTIRSKRLYVGDKAAASGISQQDDAISAWLNAVNTGSILNDPSLLLKKDQWAIQARIGAQTEQANLALGQGSYRGAGTISAGFGMAQAANPIGNLGSVLKSLGVTDTSSLDANIAQVRQRASEGQGAAQALVDRGAGEYSGQFASSMKLVSQYGKQITDLQISAQMKQASDQAASWDVQLYQANRALSDAKGLTGQITSAGKDNLGVLERQNFLLGVQLQDMGFILQQKKINFQLSMAGFTAPGDTPEERSARIKQAKIEADYAQRQLNIQRQMAQVSRKEFKVSSSRSLIDAQNAIRLLNRNIDTSKYVQAVEAQAKALGLLQEEENKKASTIYALAEQRAGDVIAKSEELAAATGKAIAEVTGVVMSAFITNYDQMITAMTGVNAGGGGGSGGNRGTANTNGHAAGFLGNVSGASAMTVGEAGTETVAVLRNPRKLLSPMTGTGGGGVTVVVTGNSFQASTPADAERFAHMIAAKVEEKLNRKGALMGFRRPV